MFRHPWDLPCIIASTVVGSRGNVVKGTESPLQFKGIIAILLSVEIYSYHLHVVLISVFQMSYVHVSHIMEFIVSQFNQDS